MKKKVLSWLTVFVLVVSMLPMSAVSAFAGAGETDLSDMDALTALGIDTSLAPEGFDETSTDTPYGKDIVSMGTVSELYTVGLSPKTAYSNPTSKAATQTPLLNQSYTNSFGNTLQSKIYGHNDWNNTTVSGMLSGGSTTTVASGTSSQTGEYTYVGTGTYLTEVNNAHTDFGASSSTGAFKYAMSSVSSGSFDGNKNNVSSQVAMVYTTDYSKNGGLFLRIGDAAGTYGSSAIELLSSGKVIGNPTLKDDEGRLVEDFAANPYQLQNYLQVTTGDWNGDGVDEIAVYVPETGASRIMIYSLQAVESDKEAGLYKYSAYTDASKWKLAWSYYLREGEVVSNMASLVSGDVNEDGIIDLAATWGYYYGPSQNKGSTAVVMFGAKGTAMLQASQQFGLTYGSSNIVRAAFTFGDLSGSGTNNLILCGQSDADLKNNNLYTRYVALYTWNGSSFSSTINKNFDLFEHNSDGAYTHAAMVTGRAQTGGIYSFYSLPLCVSNVAVVSEGIVAGTSLLYFDSLLIKYDKDGLNIKEAWDNTSAMQANTGNLKDYVEYSAASGDLTGQRGEGMLATMTQTLSSTASVVGNYTVEGEHEENIWKNDRWYYKNWWNKLWKIKTYYWYIAGTKTVNDSSTVEHKVDQFTMGKAYMVAVDPVTSYIKRAETDFSMSLCMTNTDQDSSYMKYGNKHYFTYTDPQVLAVVASPPYYADLLGRDDLSGSYAESMTSYSSSTGSGSGTSTTASISAGAYVAVEQEFSVFGVVVAKVEAEASITGHFTWDFEKNSSLEQTVTYSASTGEDMIALYSIPMEIYEYNSYVANGDGTYEEVITTVNVPHEAAVKLWSLDQYEAIAADYSALPQISGTILTHTIGDPSSYPNSSTGYDVIAEYSGVPAAVGYSAEGGASITQEISMSTENSKAFNGSVEVEFKAGAGAGGVTVGVIVGAEAGAGKVSTTTSGSSFSGEMQNMPIEAQPFNYAMNWKIFSYKYKDRNQNFPVVNYLVTEHTMPPTLPTDFEQDVNDTTSTSVTLTWSYDKLVAKFDIYRSYEFPSGSGSRKLDSVPMTAADSYDAESGKYYFSYTDTNLSPYTDYKYQIQTIGTGTQSNKSIYSEPLTVRTKTETGYPDITLQGLNNGTLLLYPDAKSTVTADVAQVDPADGEYKGLNYQWQKLVDGEWKNISGANATSYVFSNSGSSDALPYRCRVNAIFFSKQSLSEYQISAYSQIFTTAYSRRTPELDLTATVNGRTLTSSIELLSANAGHTAAPSGTITFNIKSTDYEYNRTVALDKSTDTQNVEGVAKYYSTASFDLTDLKDGVYTVTAYYSGSRVFKSLSVLDGELAIIGAGSTYRLALAPTDGGDAVTNFTYGDAIYPTLSYISKDAGGLITSTNYTNESVFEYSTDGSNYSPISRGSRALNTGYYTMRATYGGSVVATQTFNVVARAIIVTIPTIPNVSAGADVVTTQPVPTLDIGSTMAQGQTLDYLALTYTAYNSAGNQTPLDSTATPGNYTVIACTSSTTDPVKYANYEVTYTAGRYTIIGVTHELSVNALDFSDSNGTRRVGSATIKDGGGSGNYSSGTTVTMLATADAGYEVKQWEAIFADNTRTTQTGGTTFFLVTQAQAVSVRVIFKASVYTLSTSASPNIGGAIVCDAPSFSSGAYVSTGAKFKFTARAAQGYSFDHWELSTGGSPSSYNGTTNPDGTNSYTVTVGTSGSTLYAVFERDSYPLTLSGNIEAYYWFDHDGLPGTEKIQTFIPSGSPVKGDTEVTVRVKAGYAKEAGQSYFVNTLPVASTPEDTYTFRIVENTAVDLATSQGSFSVTAEATDEKGNVSITVGGEAQAETSLIDILGGSRLTFKAKAIRGFVFDHWTVKVGAAAAVEKTGETNLDTSNTLTISELAGNTVVSAVFKANTSYKFTASVNNTIRGTMHYTLTDMYGDAVETNSIYGNGDEIIVYKGESVYLETSPTSGNMVEQWLVNGNATPTYNTSRVFANIAQTHTVVVYLKSSTGYKVSYSSASNGTLTATANDVNFNSDDILFGGSRISFTAVPQDGYVVEKWTKIAGLNTLVEETVKNAEGVPFVDLIYPIDPLNGHYKIKVYFTPLASHNINTEGITGGRGVLTYATPVSGSGTLNDLTNYDVRANGTVRLTFTAEAGYATDQVYLSDQLSGCGQAVTVTENVWGSSYDVEIKNITAPQLIKNLDPFYPLHAVSLTDGTEGIATFTGVMPLAASDYYSYDNTSALVRSGAQVLLRMAPGTSYEVDSLTVDDIAVSPQYQSQSTSDVMTYTVENIQSDTAVIATYKEIEPLSTVTYGPLDKTGSGFAYGSVSARATRKGMAAYAQTGLVDDSLDVYRGGQIVLTATPDDNRHKFVSWTINGEEYSPANPVLGVSVVTNELRLEINNASLLDYTIEALFESVGESITYGVQGQGRISAFSSATAASFESGTKLAVNSLLTFTAIPDTGYIIEGWYLNSTKQDGELASTYNYQYSSAADIGADIEVKFVRESYAVTHTTRNGSISGIAASPATIQGDTILNLTASAEDGYLFSHWRKDGIDVGNDNPFALTVLSDTVLQAVFVPAENTYSITFTAGNNGSISASSSGRTIYSEDLLVAESAIRFSATPAAGYQVKAWKLNGAALLGTSEQRVYDIASLLADTVVEVEFETIPTYTISLNAYTHGTVTAKVNNAPVPITNNILTVSRHDNVVLTAKPSAHYAFDSWGQDASGSDTSLSIFDVTSGKTISATFVAAEYIKFMATNGLNGSLAIKSISDGEETVLRPGTEVEIVFGSTVTLTANPANNHMVASWVTNGVLSPNLGKVLVLESLSADTLANVAFEPYLGYDIPVDADTYRITDVRRIPNDTNPTTQIRDRGSVSFTVTLKPNFYVTHLNINGLDCMVSGETVTGLGTLVKSVANDDNTYGITLTNVKSAITIDAVEYSLEQKADLEDADLSGELKAKEEFNTAEKVRALMQASAISKVNGATAATTAIYDVKLKVKNGADWEDPADKTLPAQGVLVTLPYPAGITYANSGDYNFSIAHLISTGPNAGTIEYLSPTPTPDGLEVRVYNLSPFSMGWAEKPVVIGGGGSGGGGAIAPQEDVRTITIKTTQPNKSMEGTLTVTDDGVCVEMDRAGFNALAQGANADLIIDTGIGIVTLNAAAVEHISKLSAAGNIVLNINKVDSTSLSKETQDMVGSRPVYDLTMMAGTAQISDFGDGFADISIPYNLQDENPNALVVYYIDDTGALHAIMGAYKAKTKTVDFTVRHFSTYAVGYNKVEFTDISSGEWYYDAVTFMAARNITTGTGDGMFSPKKTLTRGQFIVMLMRAYQIEPDENPMQNFADAGNGYYTNYLAAAKRLGISTGFANNMYRPEAQISREDLFTLLYRTLVMLDKLPLEMDGLSISTYDDKDNISEYALLPMRAFVEAGVVAGSHGKLDPSGISTRAQMAQVLYNLLSK